MTLPIPEGWYELLPGETIRVGDKWCIRETEVDHQWLFTGWVGCPILDMANNRYIRKISSEPAASASLSTQQDNQSTY